jgi:CHAD domain-containing protein
MNAPRSQNPFQLYARLLQITQTRIGPEQAHRLRTTARRMQAFSQRMELSKREKHAIKESEVLRKRAGKLRNIDVQLVLLNKVHTPNFKAPIESLQLHLQKKREKLEGKLNKRLQRLQEKELGIHITAIAKRMPSGPAHAGIMAEVHTDFAQLVADHVSDPKLKTDDARLHNLRTRLKKIRYRAEAAGPLPSAIKMVAQLKKVQDAIGHWHDCTELLSTASEHLQEPNAIPLLAQIRSLTASARSAALQACHVLAAEFNSPKKSPRTVVQPIRSHSQTA